MCILNYIGSLSSRKQGFLPGPSFLAAERVLFGTKGHWNMFINTFQRKYLAQVSDDEF